MIECTWTATHDHGPQAGHRLNIRGTCTCPTPGYTLGLSLADEQSDNPRELVLRFEAIPPGQNNPVEQVETDCHVEFGESNVANYDTITIQGDSSGTIDVSHVD